MDQHSAPWRQQRSRQCQGMPQLAAPGGGYGAWSWARVPQSFCALFYRPRCIAERLPYLKIIRGVALSEVVTGPIEAAIVIHRRWLFAMGAQSVAAHSC
jgi:hypothetical protein